MPNPKRRHSKARTRSRRAHDFLEQKSSVRVAANLVAEGRAGAFVSAGNTGATWTSARAVIGMIEGVSRPALAAIVPSSHGHTLLLDVGANVDAKPNHLREFAVMG